MYTVVAYKNDYDYPDGPYIYQFATEAEADKAEAQLLSGHFSVERQISQYIEPIRYYSLTSIVGGNTLSTKIEFKIEEHYTYQALQENLPKLIDSNIVGFINYYGYSQNKEKLENFQILAEKQIKEYKLVKFKSGSYNGGDWYINQTVPRFIVERSSCNWWSDGEFISKLEEKPVQIELRASGVGLSGIPMVPSYYDTILLGRSK